MSIVQRLQKRLCGRLFPAETADLEPLNRHSPPNGRQLLPNGHACENAEPTYNLRLEKQTVQFQNSQGDAAHNLIGHHLASHA
jgi:hypothetical protein